jgi:hypothetical protein
MRSSDSSANATVAAGRRKVGYLDTALNLSSLPDGVRSSFEIGDARGDQPDLTGVV